MAIRGKNMVDIKQGNRAAVLTLLHEQGAMSRKQIASALQLTPAAITMIVAELIDDGLLRETGMVDGNGAAGRKEILIDIDGKGLFAIGVSFGIESAIIAVTDLHGELLSSDNFLFDYDSGAKYIITRACGFMEKLLREREQQGMYCMGVGVAVRGTVNEAAGVSINTHGAWPEENLPVLSMIRELMPGYPVYLRQNVRALAETFIFSHREEVVESMLLVKNDTGIGSALVIGHKVYGGYRSNASEMGHITIDDEGKLCRCGSIGCLETIASCRAMESSGAAVYGEEATPILYGLTGGKLQNLTFQRMTEAAQQGEKAIQEIIDRAVYHFGRVLRMHMGILDVQKIVLHGSVFNQPYYMERLKNEINFDGRYANLNTLLTVTEDVWQLNTKCSSVLAVKAFYNSGGLRNGE